MVHQQQRLETKLASIIILENGRQIGPLCLGGSSGTTATTTSSNTGRMTRQTRVARRQGVLRITTTTDKVGNGRTRGATTEGPKGGRTFLERWIQNDCFRVQFRQDIIDYLVHRNIVLFHQGRDWQMMMMMMMMIRRFQQSHGRDGVGNFDVVFPSRKGLFWIDLFVILALLKRREFTVRFLYFRL